jgi:predicted HAD superfamily Cof-like phosphohydrolase
MYQQDREDFVRQFHRIMGQEVNVKSPTPTLLEFRYNLLVEELKELGEEIAIAMAESGFKAGIPLKVKARLLKEMADVQYVLSGLAVTLGLPLQEAFIRVHRSNLSKLNDNGKPIYREDGKVQKGPNYLPPDMETLLETVL